MPLPARIQGPQIIELRDILSELFSLEELDDFLLGQFNLSRERKIPGDTLDQVSRKVVEYFDHRAQVPALLENTLLVRPHDPSLISFIERLGGDPRLPSGTPGDDNRERIIRKANSLLDVRAWTHRLATVQHQVCLIEVPTTGSRGLVSGSGFLIAPDLVITNHHVVEQLIKGNAAPAEVTLRFDHAILEDGVTVNQGTLYRLARTDWLVDTSPSSPHDMEVHPVADPRPDELDFALLRVLGAPGDDRIGGGTNRMTSFHRRGWITPPQVSPELAEGAALYILQHARGEELKLALDTEAIIGVNRNGTRVRYRTNTEPGSSGSPCFNANWDLVALHHAGDPDFSRLHHPEYNQGIPFARIIELLERRGTLPFLTG